VNPTPKSRPLLRVTLIVLALSALALPSAATAATKRVAKEGTVESLGKTVLTNNAGRTLYSLSVEKHGKFICTGSCLALWHPLVVSAGTKPTGPAPLGTVKRPDGRTQVTYKGRPLYSFKGDKKPGEANGEGFKDVGTWHPASLGRTGTESNPPPQEPPPSPYPMPAPPTNPAPSPSPSPSPYPPSPYPER
jgi:predicted lipoprotein with Yx(FWY)xxD motif